MRVRQISSKDHDTFLSMVETFYTSTAVQHDIPISHAETTFQMLMRRTPYADCFIAEEEDGKPLGYCLLSLTWSNEAGGMCVWFEELMVNDDARGQGIGTKLMETARLQYPDAVRFRLEITPVNQRAQSLYESMGFKAIPYIPMSLDL